MISYTTILSPLWNVVRELYILAIAESKWKAFLGQKWHVSTEVGDNSLPEQVDKLQVGSIQHTLLSAISRSCFCFPKNSTTDNSEDFSDDSDRGSGSTQSHPGGSRATRQRQQMTTLKPKRPLKWRDDYYGLPDDESSDESSDVDSEDESDDLNPLESCYCGEDHWNFLIPHRCPGFRREPSFYLRNALHYLYQLCKKGAMEPQESFLRVSKRFD